MGDRLKDKVAIIFGGGQTPGETVGNGRATAILLAREGAAVVVVDRDRDSAEATAALIAEEGGVASVAVADVTSESQIESAISGCLGTHGRLDILHNNVGVGAGDEVVIPANAFVATATAAVRIGAVPVLVDCDPVHLLVDVDQVARRIGPRTRALVPVHLYGQMAPVERLSEMARAKGIAIVEDAAQAHGATGQALTQPPGVVQEGGGLTLGEMLVLALVDQHRDAVTPDAIEQMHDGVDQARSTAGEHGDALIPDEEARLTE